ncbi:ExbD/TolR family protein [Actibacterium sp. D379-3]
MTREKGEPTIALINIVFLMLVFFLVAGSMAQPLDPALQLVSTRALEGSAPPDALVLHADGTLSHRGQGATETAYLGSLTGAAPEARILPDRNVAAERLLEVAEALRAGGAGKILIVTEKELK